ncbi:TatA/E family protein of Tat protein translocase [Streptacidiphilus sp. MAP12-33]|uniref:twin-arginine translocase TatA/TatE family subunit n=1 Tax=Streptacidiphilus sp. MAP12-33 TaxID=3156266 RepID=UPI00351554D7
MLENRGLEIALIALVVLLLFGAKRLPGTARALGRSLRVLKAEAAALHGPAEPLSADDDAAGAGDQV